jgi:hypothetical protein
LQAGYNQLSDLYGAGRTALTSAYDTGTQPLYSVFNQGQSGANAYADASGANGPEGLARAKANFQAGPGFDFQLNRGIDALTRAGAAKGIATGNTLRDAQEFGSGLANQEWGNYVSRLQPFLGQSATAAGNIGTLGASKGNQLLGSFQSQGGAAQKTQADMGQATAEAAMDANRASAQGWETVGKAATIAATIF